MFINEPQTIDRAESQKQTDKMIQKKLGCTKYNNKNYIVVDWNSGRSSNKFF